MATELTPAECEAIRERANAATEGPWYWAKCYEVGYVEDHDPDEDTPRSWTEKHWAIVDDNPHNSGKVASLPLIMRDHWTMQDEWLAHPDIRFVQHARTDIPALLSTIDALRAENTRLREALESIVRRCHGPHTAAADIARTALENPRP